MKDFYQKYWQWRMDTKYLYKQWIPPRINIAIQMILQDRGDSNKEINILDIGCGEGTLGKVLRERVESNHLSLVGLDISEIAIGLAGSFYDSLHVMDVEDNEIFEVIKTHFDYVVCLETLEHVFNPELLLKKVNSILRPEGHLIVSFPNFAHYRDRITVLLGEFPLKSQSLFDDVEHLHYFTWSSFSSLLHRSGFEIEGAEADCGLLSKFIRSLPFKLKTKLFPIFGKQIIIKARQSRLK
jgi:methionine biosynthesis protein MetW